MRHHDLDVKPIPAKPIYINESWIGDVATNTGITGMPAFTDNVRIYVPIDLNKNAILHRMQFAVDRYDEANEENEYIFEMDVRHIINQLEIYNQVWTARGDKTKGAELAREIIELLEDIEDGCAETFPFELIEELRSDYDIRDAEEYDPNESNK